jgi:hypothetical protein
MSSAGRRHSLARWLRLCYAVDMRIVALILISGVLALAIACGSDGDETPATSTAATPAAQASEVPGTPFPRSELSIRGENVEKVANASVQRVTWADGTVYEETIPSLMLRTIDRPDEPHGRRVVAAWLGDDRWQVTIFVHIEDRSTDPVTVIDLRGELYYDEASETFEAANGRAFFALTGKDPCPSDSPDPDLCPLDKEVVP